jgi:hypothetical protein
MMLTFAWLQPLTASAVDSENVTEDGANTRLPVRLDTVNLAVVMMIVGVILAFLVGSTFI